MRTDLQRLKRDTETGRVSTADVGALVPPAQTGTSGPTQTHVGADVPIRPSRAKLGSTVGVAIVVVAALIAGGLYYRSHRTKPLTDKDTVVLADFDNSSDLFRRQPASGQGLLYNDELIAGNGRLTQR
jgi:eukaryotic-like serine/threonine-protein kinase